MSLFINVYYNNTFHFQTILGNRVVTCNLPTLKCYLPKNCTTGKYHNMTYTYVLYFYLILLQLELYKFIKTKYYNVRRSYNTIIAKYKLFVLCM